MSVELQVDFAALDGMLASVVAPKMTQAAGRVRDHAKMIVSMEGRVDTGMLRDSIVSETATVEGQWVVCRVWAMAPHARFQHEGTANDGAGYIVPTQARVLRFQPRGQGFVFRPKVRGVRGIRFLYRALERTDLSDFR